MKSETIQRLFSKQCTPIINSSVQPPLNLLTDKQIDRISIQRGELIPNLNPNKATGSDEISGQMLLLCDNSVLLLFKIIFQNIFSNFYVT